MAGPSPDIISGLPDEILCRILSCLSAEDAVRTTFLSSRWNRLWSSIQNLRFDDWPMCSHSGISRSHFLSFVDRVLALHQSKTIHEFQLTSVFLRGEDLPRVREWVRFAADRNVRLLALSLQIRSKCDRKVNLLKLPPNIFTCKTLVELRLCNGVVLDIPDSVVNFPSLKTLHIRVEHLRTDPMKMLFRSSPKLEDLSMDGSLYSSDSAHDFNIMLPNLRTLNINIYILSKDESRHRFHISTPNLEYLTIAANSLVFFMVNKMPHLKRASVSNGCYLIRKSSGITQVEAGRALEILRGINHTKTLTLTRNTMTVLGFSFHEILPTFANLTSLKLEIESSFRWKMLAPVLNKSPNLQVLILDLWKADKLNNRLSEELVSEYGDWVEPETAPCCLVSGVKVMKIARMQRKDQQLKVVKYLLQHGEVLEKLSVSFSDSAGKEGLQKEILMSPKGSKACEIRFF